MHSRKQTRSRKIKLPKQLQYTNPAEVCPALPCERLCAMAYGVAVLLFAWLMSSVPIVAIPEAQHDDALFVRQAKYLLAGQWLGPYDNLTLAKGPFYSAWIAFSWVAGLPILVSQALAYALSCWLLVRGMRPWLRSEAIAFAVFLLVLFNPITFSLGQLRIIREGIYVPLTILIFALVLWWFRFRDRPLPVRAGLAAALGAAAGLFWCTREEGLWIVPSLAASFGVIVLSLLAEPAGPIGSRLRAVGRPLCREAGLAGLAVAVATSFVGAVGWVNMHYYGVADVVEFKQREFLSAYGALSRVQHQQASKPYVVIPREVLERIYTVSPAAAELRPFFDGPMASPFVQIGCDTYAVVPCDGEIRAAWFVWAFRAAVAHAGHCRSAPEAQAFYKLLAEEVDAGCNDGRLSCLGPRATMAPPFRTDYIMPTVRAVGKAVKLMAQLRAVDGVMSTVPRPAMSCLIDDCGENPWRAQFLDFTHTTLFMHAPWLPEPSFHSRSAAGAKLASLQRSELVTRWLEVVLTAYRVVLPWLLGFALSAYLMAAVVIMRWHRVEPLFVIASFCALLAGSRIGLLAYLEVVAIPSIPSPALSPAFPPLLLFAATAPLALLRQVGERTGARLTGMRAESCLDSPMHNPGELEPKKLKKMD